MDWTAAGVVSTAIIAVGGGVIGWLFNHTHKRIDLMESRVQDVHERINLVRNEYVRKEDYSELIKPISENISEIREDIRNLAALIIQTAKNHQ